MDLTVTASTDNTITLVWGVVQGPIDHYKVTCTSSSGVTTEVKREHLCKLKKTTQTTLFHIIQRQTTFTSCCSWQCPETLPPPPWQSSTRGLSTPSPWQQEEDGNKATSPPLTPSQVQRTVRSLLLEEAFLCSCFIVSRILTPSTSTSSIPLLCLLQQIDPISFFVSAQFCSMHLIQPISKNEKQKNS